MNSTDKQTKTTEKPKKIGNFLYDFVKITGAIPMMLFFRPKKYFVGNGKPHKIKGNAVITSNHISFLDPIILHCVFWRRRLSCLATKNLYDTKLKKWFFDHMHCIIVDKENFSMKSLHAVCDTLQSGKPVLIFPEGQVNRENADNVMSFKWGAVLMAVRGKAPVIPVYIVKREKWWQRQIVILGDPIDVQALVGERPSLKDLQRASEYVHDQEEALKNYYHEHIEKKPKEK